jgi:hypothetical protein
MEVPGGQPGAAPGPEKHTIGTFSIHAVLFSSSVVDPDPLGSAWIWLS